MSLLAYPKVIPSTKFEHRQTDRLERATQAERQGQHIGIDDVDDNDDDDDDNYDDNDYYYYYYYYSYYD